MHRNLFYSERTGNSWLLCPSEFTLNCRYHITEAVTVPSSYGFYEFTAGIKSSLLSRTDWLCLPITYILKF